MREPKIIFNKKQRFVKFKKEKFLSREEIKAYTQYDNCRFAEPDLLSFVQEVLFFLKKNKVESYKNYFLLPNVQYVSNRWERILTYLKRHNIIKIPQFQPRFFINGFPHFFSFFLEPSEKSTTSPFGEKVSLGGVGSSIDSLEEAFSKSLGEFLERYSASALQFENFFLTKDISLHKAIDLTKMPRMKLSESSENIHREFSWMLGEELLSRKKAYIPAQCTFWAYKSSFHSEKSIRDTTTSGLGAGFTLEEATVSALYENIERDAFFIHWLNGNAPKQISLSESTNFLSKTFLGYMNYLKRFDFDIYFLDITSDFGIPTCTCLIRSKINGGVAIGNACGFVIERVLTSALLEAFMVFNSSYLQPSYTLPKLYVPFTDKNLGRSERLSLWSQGSMGDRIDFFLQGETCTLENFALGRSSVRKEFKNKKTELQEVLAIFNERNKKEPGTYEVFRYEFKNEVLDTLKYKVVRIVVPALIPLYLNESFATLDAKRLREVPPILGFPAKEPGAYTVWPHPFP